MMDTRHTLPLLFRALNLVGRSLRAIKMPIAEFDEKSVCKAATRQTGLSDFGDPYHREGLLQLLDSAENDAKLHFTGRVAFYRWIVTHLSNRLQLMEFCTRKPEILARPLVPPIVILGLPRSGTTLLHRMLAVDPAHRGVPMWQLMRPIPPIDSRLDRRRQSAEQEFNLRIKLTSDVDRKHYIRPDEPEECMWMLGLTFVNISFWMLAPVYGYLEWYMCQDLFAKKYREYRWLLQVLQAAAPSRRLILKAPEHVGKFDVLQQMVPEALIIQTHRDPVTIANSLNSLFYSAHIAVTDQLDVHRMGKANLDMLEFSVRLNIAARRQHPGAVYDIFYDQLVADPVGTVRDVYDRFGLEWPDDHEERLQAFVQRNPKDKYGRHRYKAEDFGLTDDVIADRLRAYSEEFGYT